MESIGEILNKRKDLRGNFEKLVAEVMKNKDVQSFIATHQMTSDEIQRSYSKFYEFVREREKFEKGEKRAADGYEPVLIMNHGYADVSYQTTSELAAQQAAQTLLRRVKIIGLPKDLKQVTLEDIALDDVGRIEPYQALVDFIANFPEQKGLYLYGDFGVGKSFMMAAMANELAKKGISTTLLHYPTFISDLDFDTAKVWVNEIKQSQVLVLDDIGAEQNNAWVRDSILQVVLQHRMQEDLPTFFTSNLNMNELEQHLAETKRADEIWPAKRVMERVKYLSRELRLEGINRRHD
ncbi:primosomal protein DnaI [Lactococcus allomyrinae]|uniref:Primosomal protein DnaI n=1 Tax=Lactococcus allomyrinae TaxID=2419773 RepID=A0A387BC53_9LACT|nr:primosomal protein DnaI [Lactococcus allomyrinae]AYF99923.1 primosomal protein DnaI [Lactococcus allomyrinae]